MSNNPGVYKFTTEVQLKILTVLWRDLSSIHVNKSCIKPKYFSKAVHVDICRIIFDYHDTYKKLPTRVVLAEEIHRMCENSTTKKEIESEYEATLEKMSTMELFDLEYIKDKIKSFGKRQALVDAIFESVDILENKPDTEYSKIERIVKDAQLVGEDTEGLATDYFENVRERFEGYLKNEDVVERIPTNMDALDKIIKGGLGRTEMGIVVAPPGRGKTTFLISVGAAAIQEGFSVLHIVLENNINMVLRNYDTRLLEKDFNYIRENIDASVDAVNNIKRFKRGQLKVRKYPPKAVTVNTIRGLLDQLKQVEDFKPDVLIIDYGAILKPVRNFKEKRNGLEDTYEQIRALADEYDCAVWSAAQGSKAALSKKVVTMADIAECFAIANTADIMVCLCQTNKEKESGRMRLFLAKVRDSEGGKVLNGIVNYETKKMDFTNVQEIIEDDDEDDDEHDWE